MSEVDGLGDVEVKERSGRDADVVGILVEPFQEALRVDLATRFDAGGNRVSESAVLDFGSPSGERGNEVGRFRKRSGPGGDHGGEDRLRFGVFIGSDEVAAEPGRAIGLVPFFGIVAVRGVIQHGSRERKFATVLENGDPVALGTDPFASGSLLGNTMNLSSGGNNQSTVVPDILDDQADDGRFNVRGIYGIDQLALEEATVGQIELAAGWLPRREDGLRNGRRWLWRRSRSDGGGWRGRRLLVRRLGSGRFRDV